MHKKIKSVDPYDNYWEKLCKAADDPEMILCNKETEAMIRLLSDELSPKQKLVFIFIDLENTHGILWSVMGDYFLTEDYTMWVESRVNNNFAWIISGLFLAFAMIGLIRYRQKAKLTT